MFRTLLLMVRGKFLGYRLRPRFWHVELGWSGDGNEVLVRGRGV